MIDQKQDAQNGSPINLQTEYHLLYVLARQAVDCWQDPLTGKIDLEKRMVELRKYLTGA